MTIAWFIVMSIKLVKNAKKLTLFSALILFYVFAGQGSVYADRKYQPNDSIQEIANTFIHSELQGSARLVVEIKSLDNRLKLIKCDSALIAFWPAGTRTSGNVSVGVSCSGSKPWKIFVAAYIGVIKEISVLKQPVNRGMTLTREMITTTAKDISRLNGQYVTDITPLLGYRFKSSVGQGKTITPRMLEASKMVRRGESVTLLAEAGGIQVKTNGKALGDGEQGKIIRVRNNKSKRVVEGEVVARGIVKIR